MGISVKSNGLNQTQNAEFERFYNDLQERYRYQKQLQFTTINNQLRFTDRVLANVPNYVSISSLTTNKEEQKILSNAALYFYVNNNRILVSFAARMAFMPLLFAHESNFHQINVRNSLPAITDSRLLSSRQKSRLIANFNIDSMSANQQILTNFAFNLSGWFKQRSNLQFRSAQNQTNQTLQNLPSGANINFNLMLNGMLTNSNDKAKSEVDNIITNFNFSSRFNNILQTFGTNASPTNNFDSAINLTGNSVSDVNSSLSYLNARVAYSSNNFAPFIASVSNYVNPNAYDQQGSPISIEAQKNLAFNQDYPLLPNDAKFLTSNTINSYAGNINSCGALGQAE